MMYHSNMETQMAIQVGSTGSFELEHVTPPPFQTPKKKVILWWISDLNWKIKTKTPDKRIISNRLIDITYLVPRILVWELGE